MSARSAAKELLAEIVREQPQSPQREALIDAMLESIVTLAEQDGDTLDLKIAEAALTELVEAFGAYQPYRAIPKLTIFGSARTPEDHPLYALTREFAAELHQRGWMIVTGAGPGIMKAGMEGAGRDGSFGVNVVLPFEQSANSIIYGTDKLVTMRYFFTRKVMLTKESKAFAGLPGGFGTMDEVFEILTLIQAGKSEPAPVVLLDTPDGTFWEQWESFVALMAREKYINQAGPVFHRRFSNPTQAADYVETFYRNYHSMRMVGDTAVIRLHRAPSSQELALLNRSFGDLCVSGEMVCREALPIEIASDDDVDLPRLVFHFNQRNFDRLRLFIDALNEF